MARVRSTRRPHGVGTARAPPAPSRLRNQGGWRVQCRGTHRLDGRRRQRAHLPAMRRARLPHRSHGVGRDVLGLTRRLENRAEQHQRLDDTARAGTSAQPICLPARDHLRRQIPQRALAEERGNVAHIQHFVGAPGVLGQLRRVDGNPRLGHVAIKRDLPAIDPSEMPQPRPQPNIRRKRLGVPFTVKRPRLSRAATARGTPPDPPTDLAGLGFASFDIHGSSRALATPPRPLRLPFYRNAGGAAENLAAGAMSWRASRRGHRVRSAESDRHGQLPGAHHRGPRAGSSSPRPGHTAPHAPASSARWPTAAPPARRPSPPGRGDT